MLLLLADDQPIIETDLEIWPVRVTLARNCRVFLGSRKRVHQHVRGRQMSRNEQ
jgi:hypothetical protein